MNPVTERIIAAAKQDTLNTVGYYESSNKKEFEKGMGIFITKITDEITKEFEFKDRQTKWAEDEVARIKEVISNFKNLFVN